MFLFGKVLFGGGVTPGTLQDAYGNDEIFRTTGHNKTERAEDETISAPTVAPNRHDLAYISRPRLTLSPAYPTMTI